MSDDRAPPDCETCGDVGAYLLGALGDGDVQRFEAHLASCPLCAEELGELEPVAALLAAGAPPAAPPPALRDRIMAEVRREAQLLRAAGDDADRVPARRRRIRIAGLSLRPVTAALAAAAAAASAAAGFVVGDVATHRSDRGGPQARTVVPARVARDLSAGARASLSREGGATTLHVRGFPRPRRGYEYQVWLGRGERQEPTPALFTVGRDGSASVDVPGALRGVRQVLVTPERAGGSASGLPSRSPIVTANIG